MDKVSLFIFDKNRLDSLYIDAEVAVGLSPSDTETQLRKTSILATVYGYLGTVPIFIENSKFSYAIFLNGASNTAEFKDVFIWNVTSLIFVPLFKTYYIYTTGTGHASTGGYNEDPREIIELNRLLTNRLFHFGSVGVEKPVFYDLSRRFVDSTESQNLSNFFLWNKGMISTVRLFDENNYRRWIVPIICGSVEVRTVHISCHHRPLLSHAKDVLLDLSAFIDSTNKPNEKTSTHKLQIILISRLSWLRVGTRFIVRGVNDDGHVANFVETEQGFNINNVTLSFIQIRGSVPLFWSQPGFQVGYHKIKINRTSSSAMHSFNSHLDFIKTNYGQLKILNLLSVKKSEHILCKAFQDVFTALPDKNGISMENFDFHTECSNNKRDTLDELLSKIRPFVKYSGSYISIVHTNVTEPILFAAQQGVIRTNCIDCLDRTNAMQMFIATDALPNHLEQLGIDRIPTHTIVRIRETLVQMWHINGNNCSLNYAGTAALEKSNTKVSSKFRDGAVAIKRALINNFMDDRKNTAITTLHISNQPLLTIPQSMVLSGCSTLPPQFKYSTKCPSKLVEILVSRKTQYLDCKKIKIGVGTWNVNGGCEKTTSKSIFFNNKICNWVFGDMSSKTNYKYHPDDGNNVVSPDILALGFQEIVDLTASNIINAGTEQLRIWSHGLHKYLNSVSEYVLITAEQLVGVCLFLFAKPEIIPYIREVSTASVKTGLKGTAGNKGGVGISINIYSSTVCFICSHFAAGQGALGQRNQDFHDIYNQMLFNKGRKVASHDFVFWCGDLNYRINMTPEIARSYISKTDYVSLKNYDQLAANIVENKVFRGFREGPLMFPPTYKYDMYSERYDTSEKNRVPSWTDRILWLETIESSPSESNVLLNYYGRAEINSSDHRPVAAHFTVNARRINYQKLASVYRDVLSIPLFVTPTLAYQSMVEITDSQVVSSLISEFYELYPQSRLVRFHNNMLVIVFPYEHFMGSMPKEISLLDIKFRLRFPGYKKLLDVEDSIIKEIEELSVLDIDSENTKLSACLNIPEEDESFLFDFPFESGYCSTVFGGPQVPLDSSIPDNQPNNLRPSMSEGNLSTGSGGSKPTIPQRPRRSPTNNESSDIQNSRKLSPTKLIDFDQISISGQNSFPKTQSTNSSFYGYGMLQPNQENSATIPPDSNKPADENRLSSNIDPLSLYLNPLSKESKTLFYTDSSKIVSVNSENTVSSSFYSNPKLLDEINKLWEDTDS